MKIAIFDLDGCISNDIRRRKLIPPITSDGSDYDAYHSGLADDEVMNAHSLLSASRELACTHFLFITARPEIYRYETAKWLHDLLVNELKLFNDSDANRLYKSSEDGQDFKDSLRGVKLLMRSEEQEMVPSEQLKPVMFEDYLGQAAWNCVAVTFDDLPRVCAAYWLSGVSSLNVMLMNDVELISYEGYLQKQSELQSDKPSFELIPEHLDETQPAIDIHLTLDAPRGTDLRDAIEEQALDPESELSSALRLDHVALGDCAETEAHKTTDQTLNVMAETFKQRNSEYRDNYLAVGPIMGELFPEGVSPELLVHPCFHLLELVVVKLTRLAFSELEHKDSAHDAAVYLAMIETEIGNIENGTN